MQDHRTSNSNDFNLYYIDIEWLICKNIKNRIKELLRENQYPGCSPSPSESWGDTELNCIPVDISRSDLTINLDADAPPDEIANLSNVKEYLSEFANFITSYWIQSLITNEISNLTVNLTDNNIFLINLIPNRINSFKRCLYLNQTPNFYNTSFEFYAINLIDEETPKKDLDVLDASSLHNEANCMFIKYFRSIDKLSHVRTHSLNTLECNKLQIRLVSSTDSCNDTRSIIDYNQLLSIVMQHDRKNILYLNIDRYLPLDATSSESNSATLKNDKCHLFFVIDDKIELDDAIIQLESSKISQLTLKYFVKHLQQILKQLTVTSVNTDNNCKCYVRSSTPCQGTSEREN